MDFVNKFKKKLWESVILFISYLNRNVNKYKNNKMLSQYTSQINTFNGCSLGDDGQILGGVDREERTFFHTIWGVPCNLAC